MSKKVVIVDVSLRDGLQNEKIFLSVEQRAELAKRLMGAGIRRMELGAFVREDKVPQMAGTETLLKKILPLPKHVTGSVLVPNEHGMNSAIQSQVKEVAIFAACTDGFSKANINCTVEESFERFLPVLQLARKHGIRVRGYLSTCFGCPFDGEVDPKTPARLAKRLLALGCFEVSLGDTIGVATPHDVSRVLRLLKGKVPMTKLAGHFHDTRGTALANIVEALRFGVRTFDASLGGLGGCPYAPGSAGNVAMEDVVYLLKRMKLDCGLKLQDLMPVHELLAQMMGRALPSKEAAAYRNAQLKFV